MPQVTAAINVSRSPARANRWITHAPWTGVPRLHATWGRGRCKCRAIDLDADAGERRKPVETHRRIGGGIGAGGEDPDSVAGLEGQRPGEARAFVKKCG